MQSYCEIFGISQIRFDLAFLLMRNELIRSLSRRNFKIAKMKSLLLQIDLSKSMHTMNASVNWICSSYSTIFTNKRTRHQDGWTVLDPCCSLLRTGWGAAAVVVRPPPLLPPHPASRNRHRTGRPATAEASSGESIGFSGGWNRRASFTLLTKAGGKMVHT
jgi:hypothetical protein